MKINFPPIAASLILLVSTMVIPKPKTFTGEITDSQCGAVGTHLVAAWETKRQCTLECVRYGAKYVLYDPTVQMAYGLDNQSTPEAFAGEKVIVTGTLDSANRLIHVFSIRSIE